MMSEDGSCCTCCTCWFCPNESSTDSDSGDDPPLPPGLMKIRNEGVAKETQRLLITPAPSSECLLRQHLKEALRRPQLSIRKQLFCMTGWNMAIHPDMRVRGTREHYSLHAIIEVRPVGTGEVQLRGVDSGLFLAMSRKGRLYGEPDEFKENTVFVETLSGAFFNYLSKKYAHLGWYVGIKKSGKPKKAHKTEYGQRAVQFLPRHPYPLG